MPSTGLAAATRSRISAIHLRKDSRCGRRPSRDPVSLALYLLELGYRFLPAALAVTGQGSFSGEWSGCYPEEKAVLQFFHAILQVVNPLCVLAVGTLVSCKLGEPQIGRAAPLNLVVVTIDTLRPDHLGCYGYSKIETPTLDGIARAGVLFENAVTQTPLTPPSHASIFTGLYPTAHHVRDTGGFILPPSTTTLATILQQQGWDTAAFISSAVLKKLFGLNQGFAVYDDQMPKPGKGHEFKEDAERRAGETVDRAVHWLEAQSGKPFFLWVHVYDPHAPYDPPAPFAISTKTGYTTARSLMQTTNWAACSTRFTRSLRPARR